MKRRLSRTFENSAIFQPAWHGFLRFRFIYRATLSTFKAGLSWWLRSKEITNFTYDLDPLNECYLAAFMSQVTGASYQEIWNYQVEIKNDQDLRGHIRNLVLSGPDRDVSDQEPLYGRRIGWYGAVRALKPRLVIETGVDKGLGACVICSALLRNGEEGREGRYLGVDINPKAGYLLQDRYAQVGKILYGDSIQTLSGIAGPVDLFINDSDHRAAYEAQEYDTMRNRLGREAVILGDNAHVTASLFEFARATNRQFLFFKEKPVHHWYPGAGIGAAFPKPDHSQVPWQA